MNRWREIAGLGLAAALVVGVAAWEPEVTTKRVENMTKNIPMDRYVSSSRGARPEVLGARSVPAKPTPTVAASPTAGPVALGVFRVTSYCLNGTTRSGLWTRAGIVAVDPRVIPLGTLLRIEGLEGEHLAADTGGGVLGKWLDRWLPTCRESIEWGSQYRNVTLAR